MCGRYYFDGETYTLIKSIVQDNQYEYDEGERDFFPSQDIPVIIVKNEHLTLVPIKWGYTMKQNSSLVINARCETLLEKRMFAADVKTHRCIVPAKGFYEWDSHKNKISFEPKQHAILLMAGIYRETQNEVTIITTKANQTMQGIHSRMPLIIPQCDLHKWLYDNQYLESFLSLIPDELNIISGQIQQSLFD